MRLSLPKLSRFAAPAAALLAAAVLIGGAGDRAVAREKQVKREPGEKTRPVETAAPEKGPAVAPPARNEPSGAEQPALLESPVTQQAQPKPAAPDAAPQPAPLRETIDADVSVRSVAVTSAFTGTEVVLFGAINNARPQTSRTDGYDLVVVFEGSPMSVLVRRKSNVGGIWLNTSALKLDRLPSYYAIASTRPLSEIAQPETLKAHRIGFENVQAEAAESKPRDAEKSQYPAFKVAAIQLKRKEGLYNAADYGVSFIGRSLFRASIQLPANVPVGQLTARVHLFRSGDMVAQSPARVMLSRQGIERSLYSFAFDHPLWYGMTAVLLAVVSGLLASALFNRRTA